MTKLLFMILLFSFSVFGQVEIWQDVKGAVLNDHCGYSIDWSSYGNIVAVGSPSNDVNGVDSGHVRIFEEIAGNWVQMGSDIEGQGSGDQNGFSLELSFFLMIEIALIQGAYVYLNLIWVSGNRKDLILMVNQQVSKVDSPFLSHLMVIL